MGKPTGKPRKDIDWDKTDKLLEAGCIGTEVAASLGVHPDTLYLRCEKEKHMTFTAYSQIKRASGDSLLRDKQIEIALKGNVTMLIWLGKQRLQQREPEAVERKPENKEGFNQWLKQAKG